MAFPSNASAGRSLWSTPYSEAPLSYILDVVETPRTKAHFRDLESASRFVTEMQLYEWLCTQNERGVAPTREALVDAAVSVVPADLPDCVRVRLVAALRADNKPRGQRKWLHGFRRKFHPPRQIADARARAS